MACLNVVNWCVLMETQSNIPQKSYKREVKMNLIIVILVKRQKGNLSVTLLGKL